MLIFSNRKYSRDCDATSVAAPSGLHAFFFFFFFSVSQQGNDVEAAAQLKMVEKFNQQPAIDQTALDDAAHVGLALLV